VSAGQAASGLALRAAARIRVHSTEQHWAPRPRRTGRPQSSQSGTGLIVPPAVGASARPPRMVATSPNRTPSAPHTRRIGQLLQIRTAWTHLGQRLNRLAWTAWSTSHKLGSCPRQAGPACTKAVPTSASSTGGAMLSVRSTRIASADPWRVARASGFGTTAAILPVRLTSHLPILGRRGRRCLAPLGHRCVPRLLRRHDLPGSSALTEVGPPRPRVSRVRREHGEIRSR
jgi:hypothetical protein